MSLGTAYLLPGAKLLTEKDTGFYETYRGIIETPTGKIPAYVKLLGPKTLVNELLSTLLGQASGLPIPNGFLVTVTAEDYPESEFLKGQRLESTLAYGSTNADAPSLARRYTVDNQDEDGAFDVLFSIWDGWQEAVVFDEWIANSDRHPGNLLIGAKNTIWLIDHSHAFKGPMWHRSDLQPASYTKNLLAIHIERKMTASAKLKLKGVISSQATTYKSLQMDVIINDSKAGIFLGDEDVNALTKFIKERIEKLPDLLSEHIGMPTLYLVN